MLELNPISEIGEGSYYKTVEEIDNAVIACYSGLLDPMETEWALTELHTDNSQMFIESSVAVYTEYRELDNYTQTTLNTLIDEYWQKRYKDIALNNQILERLDGFEQSDLINQYEGECRFLRAYNYFNLVQLYGPVVIVEETISGEDAKTMERSSIDQVMAFIKNDLKIALDYLPESYDQSELGRATSWAAKGLLAKVYLTNKEYSAAEELLLDVIENSPHQLLDDYADVFDYNNEMNDEILFAVRFMSGNVDLGSPFANYFAPLTSGSNVVNGDGKGWNYPTESIINAFEEGDLRKDVCLQESYYDQSNNVTVDKAFVNKYMYPVIDLNDAENDWPVLRYSDILLMYSEVLLENKTIADALPFLNQIRSRAGLSSYLESDIGSKYDFRMLLEQERRVEFAFENQRYFDLKRTDRLEQVMNNHFATEAYYNDPSHTEFYVDPIETWQTLLPIPQREIDINSDLTQNAGY